MKQNEVLLFVTPILLLAAIFSGLDGRPYWLAHLASSQHAKLILGGVATAIPYLSAAALGIMLLYAARGSHLLKICASGVATSEIGLVLLGLARQTVRLAASSFDVAANRIFLAYLEPGIAAGVTAAALAAGFAIRVVAKGNRAFPASEPKRVGGHRAIYGDAAWMDLKKAVTLFDENGGIVIGERYRVDHSDAATQLFRPERPESWGAGGRSPLLGFDCSFGSTHGIVFAGSGGFKTSSVTIPTALRWGGALVALDPSSEVAPKVALHRHRAGRHVFILDPKQPETGVNVLDWIGQFGGTKEEDIASVASWIVNDSGKQQGLRDDFFRASALQLLTALIADVCLSGHTELAQQTLRQVRVNLSEPELQLRKRLQTIHDNSQSEFVKENVAPFVNMTPETFSGVYASAVKETHWLSYTNYAALVSGASFRTDAIASGMVDVFINIDLRTLETHSGLARVIIGSFLNAIYNRNGAVQGRTLFLLDEAARLGYMRVLETARDAGRKYGISMVMLYQSIGQLRETYGGSDASSKWFESASWVSFAAINDPETAEYISRRCGTTTVEIDQTSRTYQTRGSTRTRSKHLTARPLIQPHEVLQMRTDEQIVFTAGNPPLRCGRAIWFRRADMRDCISGGAR
jgi:type IV secretion system protein VirD4